MTIKIDKNKVRMQAELDQAWSAVQAIFEKEGPFDRPETSRINAEIWWIL